MGKIKTSGLTPMQLSALKEEYRTGFSHFLSFSAVTKNREKIIANLYAENCIVRSCEIWLFGKIIVSLHSQIKKGQT